MNPADGSRVTGPCPARIAGSVWRGSMARRVNRLRMAGFTLIEVIVTLVVLSVVAALTIPAFLRDPVVADMDDGQGRLEALFRIARDSAVRSAVPVTVAFDSATGYAWLDVPPRQDQGLFSGRGSSPVSPTGGITLRAGGTFGGGSTLGRTESEGRDLPGARALYLLARRDRSG